MRRWVWIALCSGACVEQNPDWVAGATDSASEGGSGSASASSFTTTASDASGQGSSSTGDTGAGSSDGSDSTAESGSDGSTTGSGRPQLVFLTSEDFVPDGGLAGADALCQSLADAASFGAPFRAILSTPATPASARLVIAGPVHNVLDEVVADGAADLWDGSLLAAIHFDELGNAVVGNAWTGTLVDGSAAIDTCADWSIALGGTLGRIGRPGASDTSWIDFNNGTCSQAYPVYCLEQ